MPTHIERVLELIGVIAADVKGLQASVDSRVSYVNVITAGSTEPRPAVPGMVIWTRGTVMPVNFIDGVDMWVKSDGTVVTSAPTPVTTYTTHSIYGTSTPPGTYSLFNDGSPNIELGASFYRYGTGAGTYPNMRVIGGKIWKPADMTAPASTVTLTAYTNTAGVSDPGAPLTSFGTQIASKASAGPLVNGWNEILFDAPAAMPMNGGSLVLTYKFNSSPASYIAGQNARPGADPVNALDGTKLCWTDDNAANGYRANVFRIGTTYGSGSSTSGYGVDIMVDEGE